MQSLADRVQAAGGPPTEEVPFCPLCGSADAKFLFWNFDRLYHLPGRFGLVQCTQCDLVRLSPRPSIQSLSFYYPEEEFYSYQTPTYSINTISTGTLKARLVSEIRRIVFSGLGYPTGKLSYWQRLIRPVFSAAFFTRATYGWANGFPRHKENGFALDVGAGNGLYLSLLKHHGWRVQGLDISPKAAEMAKNHFDIDVFVGELDQLPFQAESFDHVNMSHVLEHVPDPLQTMKKVKELLKVGGTVYVEVPNVQSYSLNQSKEHWFAWDSPRHLFTFSPDNLGKLLRLAGLEIVTTETKIADLYQWDRTYRREDLSGEISPTRPNVDLSGRPGIIYLKIMSRIRRFFDGSSGDFICCRAVKPKG
jgi:SAM-dependent methyltransferase